MRVRTGRALLVAAMATGSLLATVPAAHAAGEYANATAVKSTLVDLPITAAQANCPGPPDSPQTGPPIVIGSIAVGVLNARCSSYQAASSVAGVRIYDSSDPNNTVVLDAVQSSCNGQTRTASSSVTVKAGNTGINVGPISTPVTIVTGTLAIYLNEQINSDGWIGRNAVRIRFFGPEQNQDVILAQSRCASYSESRSSNLLGGLLGGLGIKLF